MDNLPFGLGDPPPKNREFPSVVQQAGNLTKAVIKHVSNGLKLVTDEERERRMDICKKCIHYMENNGNPRCLDCGCFLKTKTTWAKENCRLGHWGPELDTKHGDCPCKNT